MGRETHRLEHGGKTLPWLERERERGGDKEVIDTWRQNFTFSRLGNVRQSMAVGSSI